MGSNPIRLDHLLPLLQAHADACALGVSVHSVQLGLRQRHYVGQLLCAVHQAGGPLLNIYPDRQLAAPAFLTEADTKLASAEWDSLAQLGAGPDWLAALVLAFAKSNPDDRRVPEALHFVVRATHLGCADAETRHYSRAAFQTLHKRYPDNPWTAKTPYWY